MITAHPQFARATVNLIWGRLMTVGFVEPYDAFDLNRLSGKNAQPTNPELLEAMAEDFPPSGFPVEADHPHHPAVERVPAVVALPGRVEGRLLLDYYPRHFARVLTGPEVIDAVPVVTGVPMQFSLGGETMRRVKQLATPQDIGRRRRRRWPSTR